MSFEATNIQTIDIAKIKKYKPNWTAEKISELTKVVTDQTPIRDMTAAKNRTINAIYKKGWSIGFGSIRKNVVLYFKPDI